MFVFISGLFLTLALVITIALVARVSSAFVTKRNIDATGHIWAVSFLWSAFYVSTFYIN